MTIQLNKEQLEAVEHLSGPALVLAGAGSGKTRVIIRRMARLMEKGIPASRILAVTFTNKAAAEMKKRMEAMDFPPPLICTFHSLGLRILRESGHHLGFENNFLIYDEEDALRLIRSCLKELSIESKKITPKMIKHMISGAKNNLRDPESFSDQGDSPEAIFARVYALYRKKLAESLAVDFDDLLILPVKLFQKFPQVLEMYQDRWIHCLVDEYQDTNKAQYALASLLVKKNKNFFVVGDPDQSIYTWRGADIQNILNFEKDWPEANIIRLEQNYRSTSLILQAANALIEHNEGRYKKNLWSDLGEGEKIHEFTAGSEREEAQYVVGTLFSVHEKQRVPYNETVIFYRTNAQSRPFEDELLKRNIPYTVVGATSFYQRKEIKDLLAFLRILVNPADTVAFFRSIQLHKKGLGESTLTKIRDWAVERGLPILEAVRQLYLSSSPGIRLTGKHIEALSEYLQLLDRLKKIADREALHELVYQTIELSEYVDLIKRDAETYEDRKANIDELVAKAIEWESQAENPTVAAFLEDLTLNTKSEGEGEAEDRVTLMSLHNGKGLEFHTVFLAGMEETLFPHINALNEPKGLEEERRLCYVGMTRAKRLLHLSRAESRFIWGGIRSMRPSRFLKEIPRKYFLPTKEKITAGPSFSPKEAPDFSDGDTVFHKDFGVGKVVRSGHSSLGLTYDVSFMKDGSTKTLLAKYAKLSAL